MTGRRSLTLAATVTVLLAGLPSIVHGQEAPPEACGEPYAPVYVQRGYPADPPPAIDADEVAVTDAGAGPDREAGIDFEGGEVVVAATLDGDAIELEVTEGTSTTTFTTEPNDLWTDDRGIGDISAFEGPSGRFILVFQSARNSVGGYWWSLDDPCTPLEPETAPPTGGVLPAPPAPATPRACSPSVQPTFVQEEGEDPPPVDLDPVDRGYDMQSRFTPQGPDSDGDGSGDAARTEADGTAVLTRADGTLRFSHPGATLALVDAGDLDGVPGDEIGVFVQHENGPGATEAWIVPGDTAPGSYDPATIGVATGEGVPLESADRNGDGRGDVLAVHHQPGTWNGGRVRILSGAVIAAADAGSDVADEAEVATVDGVLVALPRFHVDPEDAWFDRRDGYLVTAREGVDVFTLVVSDGDMTSGYSLPDDAPLPTLGATDLDISAYNGDDGWFLSLRHEGTTYYWQVTSCEGALLPEAPPAVPVPATPTYTG